MRIREAVEADLDRFDEFGPSLQASRGLGGVLHRSDDREAARPTRREQHGQEEHRGRAE